jgi:hypothetical protein
MTRTVVLVPCLNEELTIGAVVRNFRAELPEAAICVFDNGSTDRTAEEAARAGATVIREPRRGKGFVVQSMFRTIDADVYVMVDGDDTYPADRVHELIRPVLDRTADMTVGARLQAEGTQFRPLNRLGNWFFLALVNLFLGTRLSDILSGFRAMSREFVKGLPLLSGGFEIETELTIKAAQRGFRITEVPTPLRDRPRGSSSKIRIVHDGMRILGAIFCLVRDYKPLTAFGSLALVSMLVGAVLGTCCFWDLDQAMTLGRLALGALAAIALLCGPLLVATGLVLHVTRRQLLELECLYTQHNYWAASSLDARDLAPGLTEVKTRRKAA